MYFGAKDLLASLKLALDLEKPFTQVLLMLVRNYLFFDDQKFIKEDICSLKLNTFAKILEILQLLDPEFAYQLLISRLKWDDMVFSDGWYSSYNVEAWLTQVFRIDRSSEEQLQDRRYEEYLSQKDGNVLKAVLKIISAMESSAKLYTETRQRLTNFLKEKPIIQAVHKHENLHDIGSLIRVLRSVDEKSAWELAERLDLDTLIG